MKRKVLIFINYYGKPSETFISDEIEFLMNQPELEIDILHYGKPIPDKGVFGLNMPNSIWKRVKYFFKNISITKIKGLQFKSGINGSLSYLIDFIKDKNYDTIYCHFGTNGKLIAELKKIGVIQSETKIIVRFHGLDLFSIKYKNNYYKILNKISNCIILYGTSIAKKQLEIFGLNNLIYLPVGVKKLNIKTELTRNLNSNLKNSKLKILSVGRFIELKGHHISLEIIDSLKEEKLLLEIIGDGPQFLEIKEKIKIKKLENLIHLLGEKGHNIVFKKLEKADIYLYTGIFDKDGRCENQATSVLEAMAKGKIVISSRIGGIPDYLKDGINGFLCEPGNIGEFVSKIKWILDNYESESLHKIKIQAVNTVFQSYCQESLNNKLFRLIYQ